MRSIACVLHHSYIRRVVLIAEERGYCVSRSRRDISGTHTAAEPSIGAVAVSAATAVSTLSATRASRTTVAGSPRAPRAPNRSRSGEPRYLTRPVTVLSASSALSHARTRRTTIERAGTFSCRAGIRSSSALRAGVTRWSLHAGPPQVRRAGPQMSRAFTTPCAVRQVRRSSVVQASRVSD